jgi:hypothetical protein
VTAPATPKTYEIPANAERSRCRACPEVLAFVRTEKGHMMPVNAMGPHRGESHFAHCTDPKRFRKRDRVAQGAPPPPPRAKR